MSAGQKTEWNPLITNMGFVRQQLTQQPPTSKKKSSKSLSEFDVQSVPIWDYTKVAMWIAHIGMSQYASLFMDYRVDGVHLLTMDSLKMERMGIRDGQHTLYMEQMIRQLNNSKRLTVCQTEILPHAYYRSLNLGQEPPSRYLGELLHYCKH